jgi:hypothetical protein
LGTFSPSLASPGFAARPALGPAVKADRLTNIIGGHVKSPKAVTSRHDSFDSLSFDAAGFGHGKPIARDAATRFRNKWGKRPSA